MESFRKERKKPIGSSRTFVKNALYAFGVFLLLAIITFINDAYVRVRFVDYSSSLRLLDHLLAGLGIPIILFLLLGSFYKRCLFYIIWCSSWEIQQWMQRGYFQFDQWLVDVIGIAIAIVLYEKSWLRRKRAV